MCDGSSAPPSGCPASPDPEQPGPLARLQQPSIRPDNVLKTATSEDPVYQTPPISCCLPDSHVPFLLLHLTSLLCQIQPTLSCLFFPLICRFTVIPLFCFQRPRGPDLCLSLQRALFISTLQPRTALRGACSITQLLIWVLHSSQSHS